MKTLEEVRKIFEGDVYATETTGIVIEEIGPCYAKCSLKVEGKHKNAMGSAMGGAIYTLADFTFAVASNIETMNTVTAESNISFISAAKGEMLYSTAHSIKDGRSLAFYEVDITDELGTLVAKVTFTGAKVQR